MTITKYNCDEEAPLLSSEEPTRLRPQVVQRMGKNNIEADKLITQHCDSTQVSLRKLVSIRSENPRRCHMWDPPPMVTDYYKAPLDDDEYDMMTTYNKVSHKQVQFDEDPTVIDIPSRHDYDEVTRKNIWSSFREIKTNAKRNRIEFQADGFNWRECKEESDMLFQNGKLIHPASYNCRTGKKAVVRPQRKVVRASRILAKYTLRKVLEERANHPVFA